jgi:hypothetical protein
MTVRRKTKRKRKPGAGRPALPPDQVHSEYVRVALTPPELAAVTRVASAEGTTPALYGARVILAAVDGDGAE